MSDIVERLRAFATLSSMMGDGNSKSALFAREAADEIERLRAENKLLNEKVIDAQTCFERANADVERIIADTDAAMARFGTMKQALELARPFVATATGQDARLALDRLDFALLP